jgi:hypothetical protein
MVGCNARTLHDPWKLSLLWEPRLILAQVPTHQEGWLTLARVPMHTGRSAQSPAQSLSPDVASVCPRFLCNKFPLHRVDPVQTPLSWGLLCRSLVITTISLEQAILVEKQISCELVLLEKLKATSHNQGTRRPS